MTTGFALLFLGTLLSVPRKSYAPPFQTSTPQTQQTVQEIAIDAGKVGGTILVTQVIDGDTVETVGGTRVRYIGVDTPEPGQCLGDQASQANTSLVENQKVRLEMDIEKQDKYGRTLAYVWVGETLVNEELVKQGFATVTTYAPNVKYVERFLSAQKEAREGGRGLWGKDTCSAQQTASSEQQDRAGCLIKGNISSSGEKIYHVPGQRYYERTKIEESKGERWFCSEEDAVSASWRKSKV